MLSGLPGCLPLWVEDHERAGDCVDQFRQADIVKKSGKFPGETL